MKDKCARYLIIDANYFNKSIYKFVKNGLFNYKYDLYNFIRVSDIFEQNNIPEEYRKIIVKINLPFTLGYESEEYITGFPFDISSGKITKENDKKIITVSNYSYLNKIYRNEINFKAELIYFNFDDIKEFLLKLDNNGLLNLYIKSVEEFFWVHIDLDLNHSDYIKEKKCARIKRNIDINKK